MEIVKACEELNLKLAGNNLIAIGYGISDGDIPTIFVYGRTHKFKKKVPTVYKGFAVEFRVSGKVKPLG